MNDNDGVLMLLLGMVLIGSIAAIAVMHDRQSPPPPNVPAGTRG